jgi:hypothetical protein
MVDLAYHLRIGAEMLRDATLATTDTMTFTAEGLGWLNQQWGAQVILGWVFERSGWLGLAALRSLLAAITLWLVFVSCRRSGASTRGAAILTVGSGALLLAGFGLRPQILGIALFAAVNAIVSIRHRHPRSLWTIPLLTLIWANVHGSFVLLPVILGSAWVVDRHERRASRRLLAVTLLSLAATLVNPYGIRVWGYALTLSRVPEIRRMIVEWQPPTIQTYSGAAFFASIAGVIVLMVLRPTRIPIRNLLALGVFSLLGLSALRGVFWWAVAAPPLLAPAFSTPPPSDPAGGGEPDRSIDPRSLAALCLLLTAPIVVTLALRFPIGPDRLPAQAALEFAPLGVTEAVRGAVHPGERILVAQEWGSWFELSLPHNPVAVDSRIELIPAHVWERYHSVTLARQGWQEIVDSWRVAAVAFGYERQGASLPFLRSDPNWRMVYRDDEGFVFIRT